MLGLNCETNIRIMARLKKMPGLITMITMAVLLLLSGSFAAANIPLLASYADGSFFKDPKNISKTVNISTNPEIALSGKYRYVTWQEDVAGNTEIFFTRSTDGGKTFEKPHSISGNVLGSVNPAVAAYGKNVYVTWQEGPTGADEIFFSVSNDRGDQFDKPKNISKNPGASELPRIDVFGDNVFVVWEQEIPGAPVFTFDIFITGSDNGGDDFDEPKPKNISNNKGESRNADISISRDTAYVVWEDDQGIGGMLDIFFNLGKE